MSKQYGFYYNAGRCIQCRTCEVACKSTHNLEPEVKLRRVIENWQGEYPSVTRTFLSLACMHCEKPACVEVCHTGAIIKRVEDGIVTVDRDKCDGCRECLSACPYGIPQFGIDGTMQKCDFCIGIGREPACAVSCPAEALSYGTLDELLERTTGKAAERMGGPTEPSIIIIS
jgi:anaerobic dimethyl sulfoxide reductase subunit B (iron-sulfur subunit)